MRLRQAGAARAGTQYLTAAILNDLLRPRLPQDAICYLGVTMEDLYPQPDWNFVFGQASLRERVGVYSFACYRPEFYGEPAGSLDGRRKARRAFGAISGQGPSSPPSGSRSARPEAEKLLLKRSAKVMVHETGHMFGLHHCRRRRLLRQLRRRRRLRGRAGR